MIEQQTLGAKLALEYRAALDAVAGDIERWLRDWRSTLGEKDPRREYWIEYLPSYVNSVPAWSETGDIAAAVLDRAMLYLSGHPGPVVMANLETVVRVVLARPDLARANWSRPSLVFRLQYLLQENFEPEGVSAIEWRRKIREALRQFVNVKELRHEFRVCAEMMHRLTDHPLKPGFLRAVETGSRLLGLRRRSDRRVPPMVIARFPWPSVPTKDTQKPSEKEIVAA